MKHLWLPLLLAAAVASAQNREEARAALERTDFLIEEARPLVVESGDGEAIQLLEQAIAVQEHARRLFEDGKYRLTVGRTLQARAVLRQAIDRARQARERERARLELKRTAEFMSEVEPLVLRSRIQWALRLWRLARSEQEDAEGALRRDAYRQVVKLTLAARTHARRAFDVVRRRGENKARAEVERTDGLLERAREMVREIEDERSRELLDKAEGWQSEAKDRLREGRLLAALKLTLSARDLVWRAWELGRGVISADLAEQALAETERLIEVWREEIRSDGPEQAVQMLDQAVEQQAQARAAFGAGDVRHAWQSTAQARRRMNRAIELTRATDAAPDSD